MPWDAGVDGEGCAFGGGFVFFLIMLLPALLHPIVTHGETS
jgi:hypothetical protein